MKIKFYNFEPRGRQDKLLRYAVYNIRMETKLWNDGLLDRLPFFRVSKRDEQHIHTHTPARWLAGGSSVLSTLHTVLDDYTHTHTRTQSMGLYKVETTKYRTFWFERKSPCPIKSLSRYMYSVNQRERFTTHARKHTTTVMGIFSILPRILPFLFWGNQITK